jgi:hypothetical protein
MNGRLVAASALILALAFWAASGPVEASPGKHPASSPEQPKGPSLKLSVSPRNGFRPVTLTLTGHLDGVDPGDEQFCHAGIEWESRTPNGLTVTSKEDARCLHPPEQIDVQTTFTKITTISEPGTYVFRLILHRRDGDKVMSNTQEIRVLDNQ